MRVHVSADQFVASTVVAPGRDDSSRLTLKLALHALPNAASARKGLQ
jgi:hypothetical protein